MKKYGFPNDIPGQGDLSGMLRVLYSIVMTTFKASPLLMISKPLAISFKRHLCVINLSTWRKLCFTRLRIS